jgi:hypothetical protein
VQRCTSGHGCPESKKHSRSIPEGFPDMQRLRLRRCTTQCSALHLGAAHLDIVVQSSPVAIPVVAAFTKSMCSAYALGAAHCTVWRLALRRCTAGRGAMPGPALPCWPGVRRLRLRRCIVKCSARLSGATQNGQFVKKIQNQFTL